MTFEQVATKIHQTSESFKTIEMPQSDTRKDDYMVSEGMVSDLILKHIFQNSRLSGFELAEKLCLNYNFINPVINDLIANEVIEIKSQCGLGDANNIFVLTKKGNELTLDIFGRNAYVGPAPVSLEEYSEYIHKIQMHKLKVKLDVIKTKLSDLIIDEDIFDTVGPAMSSSQSLFIYGPPGTGKTFLSKFIAKFYERSLKYIAVPYAINIDGSIIKVYDPIYHKKIDENKTNNNTLFVENNEDRRWLKCRVPCIITGGELNLGMLELKYNQSLKYYEAPLHVKSNGGVFVLDDFGRQLVSPKELLNRWIYPLEEREDFLTLHTGKKFPIPFKIFVVFATNLAPNDLIDQAFLRRIKYALYMGAISMENYKKIFSAECKKHNINFNLIDLDTLMQKYYINQNRLMRACDPRDIVDRVIDYFNYTTSGEGYLSYEVMDKIFDNYFNGDIINTVTH